MHFTPTYSSRIHQVDWLFAEITRDLLERSDHRSAQALEAGLRAWVKELERGPETLPLDKKTTDQILESLGSFFNESTPRDTSGALLACTHAVPPDVHMTFPLVDKGKFGMR
jgi:hypothetical protein